MFGNKIRYAIIRYKMLHINRILERLDKYMRNTALFYFINLIYMEFIFHFYIWKDVRIWLIPALAVAAVVAFVQAFLQGLLKGKANRIFFWIFMGVDYLLFAVQLVYRSIFKQPLLIDAAFEAGGDALTQFWRETLQGILDTGLGLFAMFLGVLWSIIVLQIWKREPVELSSKRIWIHVAYIAGSVVLTAGAVFGLYKLAPEEYDEYQEFGYPEGVLERFGVLAFSVRDVGLIYLPEREIEVIKVNGTVQEGTESLGQSTESDNKSDQGEAKDGTENYTASTEGSNDSTEDTTESGMDIEETGPLSGSEDERKLGQPQVLNVDYAYLKEIGSDNVDKVTDYVFSLDPTRINEYTGLFEGYNLIYITAEGFSTAAVDEKLTPTLYQLTNSGVVVPEYYVPLWQTSTSDGEYVNLTGLIPDQQFSMKRSAENEQPFSLANYFKSEGAACYAYHNNTMDYYDRHLSHPNLGYIFKASKLGDLEEAEWGEYVFHMANPKYWPASDLEMMQATVSEYIEEERFHVYYMTVSGHMNYNFLGNKMSSLHREEVSELPYSEEGRAYIACNIELDRALQYLIEQLEAAGRLEETVICLSADHYPYGMVQANYEELMGQKLEGTLDQYRNSLILWNSEMETVVVEEPCSALDLMPTLLNLFGFSYDSRLFSGRDIFSDRAPLVVFANRSFITDMASYNKKTGEVLSRTGAPVSDAYIEQMKDHVRLLHRHASGIINNNYYHYFQQACSKKE